VSEKLRASRRLLALDEQGSRIAQIRKNLDAAMSVMLGKRMKLEEGVDGSSHVLTYSGGLSAQDLGSGDLQRLHVAMIGQKIVFTIEVRKGNLVFIFEIL
jgi:hypothetical protein